MKKNLVVLWMLCPWNGSIEKLCLDFDCWLCFKLPRPLRWRWRLLWVRPDEFHPAYDPDPAHVFKLRRKFSSREYMLYIDRVVAHRNLAHELDNLKTDSKHGISFP